MRDPSALPDAEMVVLAWTDSPTHESPSRPDMAKTLSAAMLVLGLALLLFVPISGVFFLVAGGLGLTLAAGTAAPAVPTTATGLSSRG